MAQHDYNLSNNTGALYRADNNGALQAIVTQNSGTAAPTVTFPGMLWLDLSGGGDGVMRRRNQANSAWLTDIGQDAVARAAAAAAQATADAAMPKAGGTFTGPINLPGTVPTNNQAVSRAQADILYQVTLPATQAGAMLYGAAGGWMGVLAPAANGTILGLSGGLPGWQSTTDVAAPNMVVRTKADGTIDATLIPSVATGLRFRGTFKPAVNAEYPTTGGSGAGGAPAVGDFWVIDGLTTGGFTYLTGSLAGVTVYNGDSIAKSEGAAWYRMGSSVDLEGVVRTDGSVAMAADLNMGTFNLVEVGGVIARAGTPVPLNNFSIDASNVVISPQRGTTGADLPAMAAGRMGTDLGRQQIFVGAGGTNTALLPVRFFSETAAYVVGEYVHAQSLLWRAIQPVSAGAFTASQWRRVMDTGGATFVGQVTMGAGVPLAFGVTGVPTASWYTSTSATEFSFNVTDDAGAFLTAAFRVNRGGYIFIDQHLHIAGSMSLRVSGGNSIFSINNTANTLGRFFMSATDTAWNFNTMNDAGAFSGTPFSIGRTGGITVTSGTVTGQWNVNNTLALRIGGGINTIMFSELTVGRYYVTGDENTLNFNVLNNAGAYAGVPLSIVRGANAATQQVRIRPSLRVWGFGGDGAGVIYFNSADTAYVWFDATRFNFSHAAFGPSFNPTSDRAVKTNITPQAARDLSVPFYSYNRTDMQGEFKRGTIAQDVEAFASEYVSTVTLSDGTERKALDVAGLALECALNALDRIRALESTH